MGETSWQVKARYNAKVYGKLQVDLPKEWKEEYRKKCDELGTSLRAQTIQLIENFLREEKEKTEEK